uniref:Response regulator n=1 Tax=Desulfobacca acetoxidans TaxID=60893 RepID=A0A7C3Z9W2_9BACT
MKIKVLLVDDEAQFVETLAQRLETRGFVVDTALSGDRCLAILKDKDMDVVVLDVQMPGRSGIDTLKEIKKLRPLTEVIMLTGHATVETAIEGMKLGAFDYLLKPTDIDDLVAKINKAHARKAEHEERILQATISRITQKSGW